MKSKWIVLLLVIAAGALAAFWLRGRESQGTEVELTNARKRVRFESFVTASGEVVASRYADIGSSMMGRLVRLHVKEGQRVRSGQILAEIDAVQARTDVEAQSAQVRALEAEERVSSEQIRNALAELEAARVREKDALQTLDRTRRLQGEGLVAATQLQSAQAAADSAAAQISAARAVVQRMEQAVEAASGRIAQARAQVRRAQDQLSKTFITAPLDGVISRLPVREGEMVVIGIQNQPGTTLMTISDLSSINAEVKVAEADVLRLAVGQSSKVRLEAMPDREFKGTVIEVGTSALPSVGNTAAAREFRVVVRIDDADERLRPGLTCDAEILTDERSNAMTLPLQAVVLRPGPEGEELTGVFVENGGRARFVPVKTGIIGGLDVEIVSGLADDSRVVIGPVQALRELQDAAAIRERRARP